jgi:NitT/TauT family transport system ATP-binding protein
MITADDLVKHYFQSKSGTGFTAIDGVNLTIAKGERVGIVGSTGCGKSTFLRIVLGVEKPTAGRLTVDGREPYKHYHDFRGYMAAVFQEDRLLPWRTALENVILGLEILGRKKREAIADAHMWFERLGLEGFENAYPGELSGGMRQRVAIARALILNPDVILLDEAFGHLDEVTSKKLRADFFSLLHGSDKTVVMVTHNLDEALESVERVVVFGRPAKVLADFRVNEYDKQRLKFIIQLLIEHNIPLETAQARFKL